MIWGYIEACAADLESSPAGVRIFIHKTNASVCVCV